MFIPFILNRQYKRSCISDHSSNLNSNGDPQPDPERVEASYNDALSNKKKAILDNKGKSGIYRWTNLDSNKSYVGSSLDLGRRLRNYYTENFISHPSRKNMYINNALLKYGYSKFKLDILEYCTSKNLAAREQYYLDTLNPQYNILKVVYSSLGYKHSDDALVKVRKNLEILNISKSIAVKVTNIITNNTKEYISIREAAKELGADKNTLRRYILKSKLYKDIYKLEANLHFKGINEDSNYLNHPGSVKIQVIDLKLDIVTEYCSISAAGRELKIQLQSIATYLKRNQKSPYKGRYVFKKI